MGRPVMQWQIVARDPARAADFYTKLFDWEVDTNNALNYRRIDTSSGRGINGGIWPAPPEGHGMVQLFVEVDDLAVYVARATTLGGKVIIPPQKLPDGDEMAVLLDTEGIPLGIFKSAGQDGEAALS
jgi:predicted enzyme related to lactoylglutathione lyase